MNLNRRDTRCSSIDSLNAKGNANRAYFAPLKTIGAFQKRTAVIKEDVKNSNSFLHGVVVCVVATKGGVTMYDYMKALQERFDKKPPERLVRAVQSAREEVREGEWMMRSARSCSVC